MSIRYRLDIDQSARTYEFYAVGITDCEKEKKLVTRSNNRI